MRLEKIKKLQESHLVKNNIQGREHKRNKITCI